MRESFYSGLQPEQFLSIEQARGYYGLENRPLSLFSSEFNKQLEGSGIAAIEMPVSESDFQRLLESYEVCLGECPDSLLETYHQVDFRHGKDAGQVRKERKMRDAIQIEDPKNYFHFNESASRYWHERFATGPQILREFLEDGQELHNALIHVAKGYFEELEETHPNITKAHFSGTENGLVSCSFMRLVSYDAYEVDGTLGDVAKPHFDVGNATIQAYSDGPGFWGAKNDSDDQRIAYPNANNGYFFISQAHKNLYGDSSPLQPLWHGVERIIPAGAVMVPKRHAVILFIDTPYVNDDVRPEQTLPHIYSQAIPKDAVA